MNMKKEHNRKDLAPDDPGDELQRLREENARLVAKEREAIQYIRGKVDQMLTVIGTVPLQQDELDDDTLLQLDPIGIISGTFAQILDHQKETNIQLENARDNIQAIFDSVGEGVVVLNRKAEIIAFNKKMKDLITGSGVDIIGRKCRDIICGNMTGESVCLFNQVVRRKKTMRVRSWEYRNKFFEIVGTPIFNKDGEVQRVVILYMDVTKSKQTEMALLESEDRFRDLFENATDILQTVSPDGRILMVNKAWRDTLEYGEDELENLRVFDLMHPDQLSSCKESFSRVLQNGEEFSCQTVLLSKSGRKITVDGKVNCRFSNGRPVALRCRFRDITEKLQLEEELRRSQKIEAIGLLAGGIAHDFNNLLTGIIGNIMLAKLKVPKGEVEQLLQNTEGAAFRARELTRQLLTFAKGGAPVKETASVVDIIKDIANFTLSGSNTQWRLETGEGISAVELDTGQFSQVIQNLIINSDQAMPDGGMITLRVANCAIGENGSIPLPEGRYVKIDIEDQGIGIAREYLSRIFDPYFSTKKKGSGLGLATAYSIIRNHHGLITVNSKLGDGTTMTIYLPASTRAPVDKKSYAPESLQGKGKVLIMDDDDIVRKVAMQLLSHIGIRCRGNLRRTGDPYGVPGGARFRCAF
jgi:PAS domain S-box-containing protein